MNSVLLDHNGCEIGTSWYVTCECGWSIFGQTQEEVMRLWREHQTGTLVVSR